MVASPLLTFCLFEIAPLSQGGRAYDAKDDLSAVFVMGEFALSDRLRVIGGARYEHDDLVVNAQSSVRRDPVTTPQEVEQTFSRRVRSQRQAD